MPKFELTPDARQDVIDISEFTQKKWGSRQLQKYLGGLYHQFQLLAEIPGLGVKASNFHAGCRKFIFGRHIIYYREIEQGIQIGRIIHDRQNMRKQPRGFSEAEQDAYEAA